MSADFEGCERGWQLESADESLRTRIITVDGASIEENSHLTSFVDV